MIYVISTLSNDQLYCNYADRKDVKVVTKEILPIISTSMSMEIR